MADEPKDEQAEVEESPAPHGILDDTKQPEPASEPAPDSVQGPIHGAKH